MAIDLKRPVEPAYRQQRIVQYDKDGKLRHQTDVPSAEPEPVLGLTDAALMAQVREERMPQAPESEETAEISALFVTHGMGEQVRFQATDTIVYGLNRLYPGAEDFKFNSAVIELEGGPRLHRAEVSVRAPSGAWRHLHVYEAYWAPLTEGLVGLNDVVKFLWNGAWNGLTKAREGFSRWMFGGRVTYGIPLANSLAIFAALLAIVSLLAINLLAGAIVLKGAFSDDKGGWFLRNSLSSVGLFVHNALLFLLLLRITRAFRAPVHPGPAVPAAGSARRRFLLDVLGAASFLALYNAAGVLLFSTLLTGVNLADYLVKDRACRVAVVAALWIGAAMVGLIAVALKLTGGKERRTLSTVSRLLAILAVLLAITASGALLFNVLRNYTSQPPERSVPPLCEPLPAETEGATLWESLYDKTRNTTTLRERILAWPYSANAIWPLLLFGLSLGVATWNRRRSSKLLAANNGFLTPTEAGLIRSLNVTTAILSVLSLPLIVYHLVTPVFQFVKALSLTQNVRIGTGAIIAQWGIALLFGYLVRHFLVSFVGDTAAYVSSHKLDRFFELRRKIQEVAISVGRTMYTLKKGRSEEPLYRKVAFVGHSLGSVIAYDALNSLLVEEELFPDRKLEVLKRTTLLVTSGSPLDKVAYVFSTLSDKVADLREMLASSVQPLIQSALARTNLEWVNVFSGNDVISGPLNLFDDPARKLPPLPVENVEDLDATTPLMAHTEYEEGRLIFERIDRWL